VKGISQIPKQCNIIMYEAYFEPLPSMYAETWTHIRSKKKQNPNSRYDISQRSQWENKGVQL
jgi:hypothetical protein